MSASAAQTPISATPLFFQQVCMPAEVQYAVIHSLLWLRPTISSVVFL